MIHNTIRALFLLGFLILPIEIISSYNASEHAQQKAIDSAFKVGTHTAMQGVNILLEKQGIISPSQEAQKEFQIKQTELADIHIQEAKIDKASKLLDTLQKFFSLPGNENSEKGAILKKRLEKEIEELTKDLPELTEDDLAKLLPKKDPEASSEEKPKKERVRLSSKLIAPFIFALTTASQITDYLADRSFVHITNLNCFKDTFIGANCHNINRLLVLTTVAAITYGGYTWYNKHNDEDDEDIFNNDLEY